MVSRMEKYYKNTKTTLKRSQKNQTIYDNIYSEAEYSNIEGIATIDRNNEIDLTKLKNTIKNREEYSRRKKFKDLSEEEQPIETTKDFVEKEQKIYDIRDILNKARNKKPESDEPRSLDNTNYNILKNLELNNEKKDKFKDYDDHELKELIDTITNTSALNKMSDDELGFNMFNLNKDDKLESSKSVQQLLEQAREYQEKNTATNLDNSFYTSSLNFSKDDFEDAKEYLNHKKSRGILKKIIVFVGLLLMTAIIVIGGYYLIK